MTDQPAAAPSVLRKAFDVLGVFSRQRVDTPAAVGDRLPASCTGVGKALLAFSGAAAEDGVLTQPLPRRTARSMSSGDALREQLAAIRARGYATDREESTAGLACVAVPVIAADRTVAAISVAFPAGAGTGSVFVGPLRQAAAALSASPAIRRAAAQTG